MEELNTEFTENELQAYVDAVELETLDEGDLFEPIEEAKPLTIQQRIKRSRFLKRNSKRYARLRSVKSKRMAPADRLNMRSRRAAINVLRKRAAGKHGERYSSLSPAQKMSIDRAVSTRASLIGTLSKRLLPMVRKKEMSRLAKARGVGKTNESFNNYMKEEHINKKRLDALVTKAEIHNLSIDEVYAAYHTGLQMWEQYKVGDKFQHAFGHVNSFIAKLEEGPSLDQAKKKVARERTSDREKHNRELDRARYLDNLRLGRMNEGGSGTALQRLKKFDASRVAAGKKAIFTDNEPKGSKRRDAAQQPGPKVVKKLGKFAEHVASLDEAKLASTVARGTNTKPPELDKAKPGHELWHVSVGNKHSKVQVPKGSSEDHVKIHTWRTWHHAQFGHRSIHPQLKVKKVNENTDLNKAFTASYDVAPTARQLGIKMSGGFAHHQDTLKEIEEAGGAGEWGTNPPVKKYKKDTPGEK